MINSLQPYKINSPAFGERVTIGQPGELNPLDAYWNKGTETKSYKGISLREVGAYFKQVKALVHKLFNVRGAVHPEYKKVEGRDEFIRTQAETIPPTFDEDTKRFALTLKAKAKENFLKGGEELQEKFASQIDQLYAKLLKCDPKSPEFTQRIIEINKLLATGCEMEINLETGKLEELAKSDEATIFVFNHPSIPKDLVLSFGFLSKLYEAYDQQGKAQSCPKPRYVITDEIVSTVSPKMKEIFTRFGMVPVDASFFPSGEKAANNNPKIAPVIEEFIDDKSNIVIFPEGELAHYKSAFNLEERFQYGVAKIVNKAANNKKRVKVVTVGVDYKDGLGVVHLGDPIYFEKDGNQLKVNKGNLSKESSATRKNAFYSDLAGRQNDDMIPIPYGGEPLEVTDKMKHTFMSRLIAGILCTNLDICVDQAQETLQKELQAKASP